MRIDHNSFGSLIFWLIAIAIACLCLVSTNSCVGTFSTVYVRDSKSVHSGIHGSTSQSADSSEFAPSLSIPVK